MIRRRTVQRLVVVLVLVTISMSSAWGETPTVEKVEPGQRKVGEDTEVTTKPGPVRVASTIEFDEKIEYFFDTDIGLLHAYGGSQLATFDLLDTEKPAVQITLPGANKRVEISHLSATPYLLISSAKSGLFVNPSGSVSNKESSYGLNVLEGTLVWERPALPDVQRVLVFPEIGTAILRSGKRGNDVIALDYRTGEILWSEKILARAMWVSGDYLEVVGEETCTIEPRTGRRVRETGIKVSQKAIAAVYPDLERFVFQKKGKNFVAYSLPRISPGDSGDEPIPSAEQLWEFKSASHMMKSCARIPWGACGFFAVPGDRLLVRSAFFSEMLDFSNGERKWIIKNTDLRIALGQPYSTDGKYGVGAFKDGSKVFDMDTGKLIRQLAGSSGNRVHWIDANEGMIMSGDWRIVSRFNANSDRLLWSSKLPGSANFELTWRRLLPGVFRGSRLVGNPVFFSPLNWRVNVGFKPAIERFADDGVREALSTSEEKALQRFRHLERLFLELPEKELLFVTGGSDRYKVVGLDVTNGKQRRVATYKAVKVNSIEPVATYELAISLENNGKTIKLLDW